jgi:integrase
MEATAAITKTATTIANNRTTRSLYLVKYIKNIQQANKKTAIEYQYRLSRFERYILAVFEQRQEQQNQEPKITIISLDQLIDELKRSSNKIDPYDLLSGFVAYLQEEQDIENPNTIRHFVITARNFLEYHDIEISPRKFKLRVRLPKSVIRRKEAIGKEEIREILLKCSDIKLKTYVMLLAATGMRATEALALRHKDFDFDDDNNSKNNRQAFVRIRGEFTKTRTDRYVFLTRELVEQCKAWIDFKYRRRRITKVVNNSDSGSSSSGNDSGISSANRTKAVSQWVEPKPSPDDMFFSMPRKRKRPTPRGLYAYMNEDFAKTLDRIGFGNREDGNERRREISHSIPLGAS